MTDFSWAQKRVLVTGGRGFLGSHLVDALRERGCQAVSAPSRAGTDLRDAAVVRALMGEDRFDVVFHLAASVGGIGANRSRPADFFHDNLAMGLNILAEAARVGVGRLVLLGTICAYPKFAEIPIKEESLWLGYPEETNAPYGVAKRSLIVGADAYRSQHGLRYSAVFPTNLYGPRDDFDPETSHVIPALIRKCEEASGSGVVRLWGTGAASRDFLYVTDAVEGILRAAEREEAEGQVLNLGSGREVTIAELAGLIATATGFSGTFEWDSSQPDGQPRRCVCAERARAVLGFEPEVSIEEGLAKTVLWYRENRGALVGT